MSKSYFAMDGNYGLANGLLVVDTKSWSPHMWEEVELSSDHTRLELASHFADTNSHLWKDGMCNICGLFPVQLNVDVKY
jgi:hypothetical protein